MLLFVSDDYGVLEVTFDGVVCNLVDDASYKCLDKVNYYLHICSPHDYLYYITIDTKTGIVSVYSGDIPKELFDNLSDDGIVEVNESGVLPEKVEGKLNDESVEPVLKFQARNRLFKEDSNLLRLYNMFATHRSRIIVRS